MDISGFYESLSALPKSDLNAWQSFFMKFYQAWFSNGRWQQYFKGLVSTIEVTVLALAIGAGAGSCPADGGDVGQGCRCH